MDRAAGAAAKNSDVDSRIMNQKGHVINIKEKYKWKTLFEHFGLFLLLDPQSGEKIDKSFIPMRPVQRGVWDVFSPAIHYKENRALFLSQPKQEFLQNLPSCLFLTSYIRIE